MNLESVLHNAFSKEGNASLAYVMQISSFLFFFDLGTHWTSLEPIYSLKIADGKVFPLVMTTAFLLVLFGILTRLVPFALWGLFGLKTLFWPKEVDAPSHRKESVADYLYERFAVETHNGSALDHVKRERAERYRFIENGGLFLLWLWLAWGEMTFCLPKPGTIGHLVFPMEESRGAAGMGFLICLGMTLLWIFILECVGASLQISVSPKMYRDIQDREREGEPKREHGDRKQDDSVLGISYPMQPMIESWPYGQSNREEGRGCPISE